MALFGRFLKKLNQVFWSLLPSCEETLYLISLDLDQKLPWKQRLFIRIHYHLCIYTRRYAQQLRGLRRFLSSMDQDGYELLSNSSLEAKTKQRIATQLREKMNRPDGEDEQVDPIRK